MDDVYKKQLEAFGIESVRVTKGDLERQLREDQQKATIDVIKALMDRVDGRQWLYHMMDICHVFTSPFSPGHPDVSDFLCGAQALGHKILADIMLAAPEQFYIMNQEAAARKVARELKAS